MKKSKLTEIIIGWIFSETPCAILYYLYNFKKVKNTYEEVLLLVKIQAEACNFTKSNFTKSSHFLNCASGIKSRKASHISLSSTSTNESSKCFPFFRGTCCFLLGFVSWRIHVIQVLGIDDIQVLMMFLDQSFYF